MESGKRLWSRRLTTAAALRALVGCTLVAGSIALLASRWSPLAARALLPLEQADVRALYLTTLAEDPGRVVVTRDRANSTTPRDRMRQAGRTSWIRRYRDPARPGLPDRILLTSRRDGARLLIPVSAIELENALRIPSAPTGKDGGLRIRTELVHLFVDRLFAGLVLELRFPPRPEDARAEARDFDLVVVRGNRVRTTDFLLQPNDRFYRAALVEGVIPSGPLKRRPAAELVFALFEDHSVEPLWVPVPLMDELHLAWGGEATTFLDDRWSLDEVPAFLETPPRREERERVGHLLAVHLAARIESPAEREGLARGLLAFVD